MHYKVTVNLESSVLLPLASLCAIMFVVILWVPEPYQWIPFLFMFITLAVLVGLILRAAWDSHLLTFHEETLVFPGRTIRASEIKHILIHERRPTFTIHFLQRKIPIHITFNDGNAGNPQAELRLWAWKNGVTMNVIGERKRK